MCIARSLAYNLCEPPKGSRIPASLIFLHGLFGSKQNYRSLSKVLARDLEVPIYALDLRNHGESPHFPRHDYMAMAKDVLNFIEDRGLKNVMVVGHSMGAKVAMVLALRWPEPITKLVAVDNAPVKKDVSPIFKCYLDGMSKIQAANITRQSEADQILKEFEQVGFQLLRSVISCPSVDAILLCDLKLQSLPIRQFLLSNLYRPKGEAYLRFRIPLDILAQSLDNLSDFPYKDNTNRRFMNPTLFVRGTRSNYITWDMLPAIGQLFPYFRLSNIDASHWLISEQPEKFRSGV